MATNIRSRIHEQMAAARTQAQDEGVTIKLQKAGQRAKTVSVDPSTSILDAFRDNDFKVKPDNASGKAFAVVIENVTPGQEMRYTDAKAGARLETNGAHIATQYESDFSDPVQAGGHYVIATNVEAGAY